MGNGVSVEAGPRGTSAADCLPKDPKYTKVKVPCATSDKINSAYADNTPLPPARRLTGGVYNSEVVLEWKKVIPLGLPKPQFNKDTS
ncbi:MAG: hypothetical protein S4CHLAM27_11320 [Chlamydiia bacterium]|nr:hypothetical protein [Chlamydiia bacterium]